MMRDFKDITNHLINYTIYHRIKKVSELRDANYEWFNKNYGKYASHYLHSGCSMAMGIVKSWREIGESKIPYLKCPIARLDQMLVKVKELTSNGIKLQITIEPRHFVYLELPVKHKKFKEYSKSKLGEITITMDLISLPFQVDMPKILMKDCNIEGNKVSGIDLNFNHADISNNFGEQNKVDLSEITNIQKHMLMKRHSIQQSIPKNLQKQQKVLSKYKKREHNRVKDPIIRKAKEISEISKGSIIIFEDLSTTTKECLKDSQGKKFKSKLSSWAHGELQKKVEEYHSYPVRYVYARGTSSYCGFCPVGEPVTHPSWQLSLCDKHGVLNRDKNASVNILNRGLRYLRREPFPPSVYASLLKQSVPGNISNIARQENHNEAMKGDDTNVKEEFHEFPS